MSISPVAVRLGRHQCGGVMVRTSRHVASIMGRTNRYSAEPPDTLRNLFKAGAVRWGNPSVPVRLGLLWCFEVEPFFFAGGAFIPQLEAHPCRAIALAAWLCRPRPFSPHPSSSGRPLLVFQIHLRNRRRRLQSYWRRGRCKMPRYSSTVHGAGKRRQRHAGPCSTPSIADPFRISSGGRVAGGLAWPPWTR